MVKVAVLVDLSFLLVRYSHFRRQLPSGMDPASVAREIRNIALAHLDPQRDELYRIFVYDCRPLGKKAHNPVTKQSVDFSRTATYTFRTQLLEELVQMRKVALRLDRPRDRRF